MQLTPHLLQGPDHLTDAASNSNLTSCVHCSSWSVMSRVLQMKAGGTMSPDTYQTIEELAFKQYEPPHLEVILQGILDNASASALSNWTLAHKTKILDPILKVRCNKHHAC